MEKVEQNNSEDKKIDLVMVCRNIGMRWRFITVSLLIGLVVGVIMTAGVPREYTTVVKLVPENIQKNNGEVMSLATLLGLTIDHETDETISSKYYPEIVKSTPFLMQFHDLKVDPQGMSTMLLSDYLIYHQKRVWWKSLMSLPQQFMSVATDSPKMEGVDTTWDRFHLTEFQKVFVESLKGCVSFQEDKNSNILLLSVSMQNPVVAALVADGIVKRLNAYVIDYEQGKALENLHFTENMYMEMKKTYEKALLEKQRQPVGMSNHMQLDVDMALGVCNMLVQQYDIQKVKVVKRKNVFAVIEPATVALQCDKPNRLLMIAFSVFLFGFLAVMWSLFKFALEIDYKK